MGGGGGLSIPRRHRRRISSPSLVRSDDKVIDVRHGLADHVRLADDDDALAERVIVGDVHVAAKVAPDVPNLCPPRPDDGVVVLRFDVHLLMDQSWVGNGMVMVPDNALDGLLGLGTVLPLSGDADLGGLEDAMVPWPPVRAGDGELHVAPVLEGADGRPLRSHQLAKHRGVDSDAGLNEAILLQLEGVALGAQLLNGCPGPPHPLGRAGNDDRGRVVADGAVPPPWGR